MERPPGCAKPGRLRRIGGKARKIEHSPLFTIANYATVPQNKPSAPARRRRFQVRRSSVHGRGVFALVDLPADLRLIEYTGRIISWQQAQHQHPHDAAQPNHTFYFHIDDEHVIDASHGGNSSRWINHSCDPNCTAEDADGRIFIRTLRPIRAGEELSYDYGLIIDEPLTPELRAEFACHCGSPACRGTLLDTSAADGEPAEAAAAAEREPTHA